MLPSIHELWVTPGTLVGLLGLLAFVAANLRAGRPAWHLPRWEHAFGLVGLSVLSNGQYMAFADTEGERMMGEVGRILYVHVPSAWATLVTFTFTCIFAFLFLMTGRKVFDLLVESTAEVGVMLSILLQATGMLFAKPTWGVFWDWDPRLVSTSVMMLAFIGVLSLRGTVTDPDRRATWTSVGAILATTSMIVTYFSVRWWRSIHQMQSSPETIDPTFTLVLRMNAFAFLFLTVWFVARRWRLAAARAREEEAPPLPQEVTA